MAFILKTRRKVVPKNGCVIREGPFTWGKCLQLPRELVVSPWGIALPPR